MPDISDNQRQAVAGLGCGVGLIAVLGAGLVGHFALEGLPWLWLVAMVLVLLVGMDVLRTSIQKILDSGDGGGGGGDTASDPKPDPSRSMRSPGGPRDGEVPSHWPPSSGT